MWYFLRLLYFCDTQLTTNNVSSDILGKVCEKVIDWKFNLLENDHSLVNWKIVKNIATAMRNSFNLEFDVVKRVMEYHMNNGEHNTYFLEQYLIDEEQIPTTSNLINFWRGFAKKYI